LSWLIYWLHLGIGAGAVFGFPALYLPAVSLLFQRLKTNDKKKIKNTKEGFFFSFLFQIPDRMCDTIFWWYYLFIFDG